MGTQVPVSDGSRVSRAADGIGLPSGVDSPSNPPKRRSWSTSTSQLLPDPFNPQLPINPNISPSQAALGGEWWWESMPVSSISSLMRSNPVSFRMQKAEPLSPADHRQTMRMRILKCGSLWGCWGVVRLKWGNIEDAMDWFLQVLKRNALLKPSSLGKTYETSMGTFDLYTRKN